MKKNISVFNDFMAAGTMDKCLNTIALILTFTGKITYAQSSYPSFVVFYIYY
jgi:hypothetical protein